MTFIKRAILLATIATVNASADSHKILINNCGLNDGGDNYMVDGDGAYYAMDDENRVYCNIWLYNATGGRTLDGTKYPPLSDAREDMTCEKAATLAISQVGTDCGLGGKTPSGGGDTVVDKALKYFTKDKFEELFEWIKDADARVSHGCNCAGGKVCQASDEWYTYDTFVQAFNKYPEFFQDNAGYDADEDQIKTLLASFMALSEQETGSPGTHGSLMCRVIEGNLVDPVTAESTPEKAGSYGPGVYMEGIGTVLYVGRGPFQLSWGTNYGDFTRYVKDGNDYKANPMLVVKDPFVSLSTAFWYFGVRQKGMAFARGLPEYMMHPRVINGKKRDFAILIYMINGIECGVDGQLPSGKNIQQAMNRVKAYKHIYNQLTGDFITDDDESMLCGDIPPNPTGDNLILYAQPWTT